MQVARLPTSRTAALAAMLLVAGAVTAPAADLDDHGRRYGSAYDDPRYADLYGDGPAYPPHAAPRYAEPRYEPRDDAPRRHYGNAPPIPREPIYRQHGPRDDSRYAEAPRSRVYTAGPACLHRDEIKFGLERNGWNHFSDPQIIDRGTALLNARRGGRTFQLKIDRCSGDVLAARPLDAYRPYADYGYRPYRTY